jgi:SnoaL-like domain
MFHVELRRFPNVARAFNVPEDELRTRYVIPWVRGVPISLGDRRWTADKKTRLTVYEAPAIAAEDRGMGRGWSTVTRGGREVTASVLDDARKAIAPPISLAALKVSLLAAAERGSLTPSEAVALAGRRGRASERLAVTEQAVWELLHEGRLVLVDAVGPVGNDRWESLLLSWEAWADPRSSIVLEAAVTTPGAAGAAGVGLGERPPERWFKEMLSAYAAGDVIKLVDLHAEGWRSTDHRDPIWEKAPEEIGQFWATPFEVADDHYAEVDEVLACDDRVIVARLTYRGRSKETGSDLVVRVGSVSVIEAGVRVSTDLYDPDERQAMLERYAELGGRRGSR